MIEKLKTFLRGPADTASEVAQDPDTALTALLLEAADADGEEAPEELEAIRSLLARRGHDHTKVEAMIAEARGQRAAAGGLFRFTHAVKTAWSPEERIGLVEMLWEVVYADGRVDDIEAGLMRRLGGLLHVTDRDRGAAAVRVRERLGIDGGGA